MSNMKKTDVVGGKKKNDWFDSYGSAQVTRSAACNRGVSSSAEASN